ncbi:hypothetical protein BFJ63_vAg8772 [Fusarium oxysporum f. sp. narcissi]|uniref:Uncharacterized protein n=1 Tax=Fusarium oxysporum f. sp. narcissi TaxID=451672 RepID=A0A4Q2VPD9_FUSOX|nr:hypothetical protein BFJ63_vAg8772 [Fusarium oxysporum f. sp. narcissi]
MRGSPQGRPFEVGDDDRRPTLEDIQSDPSNVSVFASTLLASESLVQVLGFGPGESLLERTLNEDQLATCFEDPQGFEMLTFFINRHLVRADEESPPDANRLRLSTNAFQLLRHHCHLSVSFTNALANVEYPSPMCFPSRATHNNLNFWFFLPTRVQVRCRDPKAHVKGKSQMNPINYLHLDAPNVDVRGSKIALHFWVDGGGRGSPKAVVVNFQDGRWRRVVEEPIFRLRDSYQDCESRRLGRDPIYLQMSVFNSALRWWNNSLSSVDDQLIAYEEALLRQDLAAGGDLLQLNAKTNRSLHCIAAHLQRYDSELQLFSNILDQTRSYNLTCHRHFVHLLFRRSEQDLDWVLTALGRAESMLTVLRTFREELQQKASNVMSLLVDNNKGISDQLVVQTGIMMHKILETSRDQAKESLNIAAQTKQLTEQTAKVLHETQKETEASRQLAIQSQRLSEEMMKDSVAMKTVALVTVLFLPGTSFAAILAMPFFTGDSSPFDKPDLIWVWVALTVPATIVCFGFYLAWKQRETRRREQRVSSDDVELSMITQTSQS